jgi:glc operon protein GlcG
MPIVVDGHVVGAVGVSGASSADEDQELATIGASALAPANGNGKAAFFPAQDVVAGGGILLDARRYKLDAGRRSAPGEPELHEREVDVMHVVQGRATVVTGGEIADGRIEGGSAQELGEGDVFAIPQGVPHQFVQVSDPFLYFVVKVVT